MKILHVINSLGAGGAENLVMNMANEQAITNEISIFSFYSENDIFSERLSSKINYYANSKQTYFTYKKIKELYKLIKVNNIIHVHLFPPFYIVAFLSVFFKYKKFIYTEHNTHNKRRKFIFKFIEKIVYSRYHRIICVSKGVSHALIKWIGDSEKIIEISNFVNIKEIKESNIISRDKLGISKDSVVIAMVGSFHEQKDQDTLIKAINILPDNYVLLLIGGGYREKELKTLVTSLDLEQRIQFLGIRSDVFAILKACDYGVLSSHWEGFGIVALEYMACGLIAIGSNVEGLKEVINEKDCLFEKGDFKQLASRIIQLNNQNEKIELLKQQQLQLQNFDIKNAVKRHFEVYTNL